MSSIALNSALSQVSTVAATAQQVPRNNTITTAAASKSDSVSLSPTAQATALQQQGYTVNEIASTLGLTTATVDSYLNLTAATSSGAGGVPSGGPSQSGAAQSAAAPASATKTASTTKATTTTATSPAASNAKASTAAASSKSSPAVAESTAAKVKPTKQ